MKKIVPIVILVMIVVAAGMLFSKRKADLAKAPIARILPVVVDSVVLSRQDVRLTLPAMGLVTSDLSTTLSTRISGQVLKVEKQEGDAVKKGDTLATIEAADLTAKQQGLVAKQQGLTFQIAGGEENVKAAATSLAAARDTHQRTLELLQVKGASIEESRREESEIAGLEAKLAAARNAVSTLRKEHEALAQNIKETEALARYATITAPIDGTVSQALARPGDMTTPGKPLFRIAAGAGLSINLSLPDTVRAKEIILHGQTLPLAAKNEASVTGLAQYLAPLAGAWEVTEGQYVNVRVVVYQGDNALVPMDALLTAGGDSFVFVYEDGQAVKTKVDIIARGSEGVVVAQALAGRKILLAKPDLLLRIAAGVPVQLTAGEASGQPRLKSNGASVQSLLDKGSVQSPLAGDKTDG
jgi:multidrug efflux pump subunit AcrA (membrane-fusion protein)